VGWGYLPTSGAKSDVIFLLGDPDFLLGRRNFASISLSYGDPHFGLFGGFGRGFGAIYLLLVQNLTSYSCSATQISYWGDEISRLSRLVIEIPILGVFGVFGATRLPELTQNIIRSSHGHSTPSLKISCKSVQPFSCNLADKETKKQRNKQAVVRGTTNPAPCCHLPNDTDLLTA